MLTEDSLKLDKISLLQKDNDLGILSSNIKKLVIAAGSKYSPLNQLKDLQADKDLK